MSIQGKFLQQRLRLLQVCRVKPFGKPAIHRGQQVIGVLALALGLPQTGQAGGSMEFPKFSLLIVGNAEGSLEAGFSLGCIRDRLLEEQFALEPI